MRFTVLGSGSRGNSVLVESGGCALLIDNGFSGKELASRAERVGADLSKVQAICLTHEHNDHIAGVGVVSRKLRIPVYANEGTLRAAEDKLKTLYGYRGFETGDSFEVGSLEVHSFRVSHDTADPVGFIVSDSRARLGYLTDTGKTSHLMNRRLNECNAVILEFNHNLEMLKNGPYPLPLQQRVRSSMGHLCNEDAAEFLSSLSGENLRYVVLAHLSEKNNTPQLALAAAQQAMKGRAVELCIAMQDKPLPTIEL